MILKRGTTTEQIYIKIKQDIVNGAFHSNERLVTEKIAAQYKVSRTPVREALKKLEKDGLIESRSNAGAVIKDIDIDEVSDIYEIRKALEIIAVKKAISRGISPEAMKRLKLCCEARKAATSLETLENCDRDFHMIICRESGSKALIEVMENYMILVSSFSVGPRVMQKRNLSRDFISNAEHEQILNAIENKDQEKASALLSEHIDSAIRALRESKQENEK